MFINLNEYITVRQALGEKGNYGDNYQLQTGIWNFIEINSIKENEKVSLQS